MENVEELIDFCLRRAEIDCFTDEQFKIRETYYDIISRLRKTSNENVGEWILSGNSEKYGGYCSKCHVDMPTYTEDWKLTYKATKFCPGCGARMKVRYKQSTTETEDISGGEWIPDDELTFDPARPWWKCPKCGERTGIRTKYCPECGKRNRRSEE